jgi:hypothetical protein
MSDQTFSWFAEIQRIRDAEAKAKDDEIARLRAENITLRNTVHVHACACRNIKAEKAEMLAALKLAEFGFNHNRCSVCAGWDGKSERDRVHSKDCPVSAVIARAEGKP